MADRIALDNMDRSQTKTTEDAQKLIEEQKYLKYQEKYRTSIDNPKLYATEMHFDCQNNNTG